MKIIDASWELKNLGCKTTEVIFETDDTWENFLLWEQSKENDSQYRVIKVPTKNTNFLWNLSHAGYTFIETQIHLKCKRSDYENDFYASNIKKLFQQEFHIKSIDKEEEEITNIIKQINLNMFDTDRIFLDPRFTQAQAAQRYVNWFKSILKNGINTILIELRKNGTKMGMGFSISQQKSEFIMDLSLGGIYNEYKGNGIITALLAFEYDYFFNLGYKKIITSVSSNNLPILNFHQMMGAQISGMDNIYVKHI